MSTFETVPPLTPTAVPIAALAATGAPEPMRRLMAMMPPAWYMALTCALFAVPVVMLVAYWLGKVKCEKLVTWAVVSWLLRCLLEVAYGYSVGKKVAEDDA